MLERHFGRLGMAMRTGRCGAAGASSPAVSGSLQGRADLGRRDGDPVGGQGGDNVLGPDFLAELLRGITNCLRFVHSAMRVRCLRMSCFLTTLSRWGLCHVTSPRRCEIANCMKSICANVRPRQEYPDDFGIL